MVVCSAIWSMGDLLAEMSISAVGKSTEDQGWHEGWAPTVWVRVQSSSLEVLAGGNGSSRIDSALVFFHGSQMERLVVRARRQQFRPLPSSPSSPSSSCLGSCGSASGTCMASTAMRLTSACRLTCCRPLYTMHRQSLRRSAVENDRVGAAPTVPDSAAAHSLPGLF